MICRNIQTLINYGLKNELISEEDVYVVRNQLMDIVGLEDWNECCADSDKNDIDEILAPIIDYAAEKGLIESNTVAYRDLFDTKIMGIITPRPSEVVHNFTSLYSISPKAATDYF